MDILGVPDALQQRLGDEATAGLLQLIAQSRKECTADVIDVVGDRFERRLVEETSKLRVEMAQGFAGLREQIAAGDNGLGREMMDGFAALRQEITNQKLDILKWAFLFWVGQFFAVGGPMAVLIRVLRPA